MLIDEDLKNLSERIGVRGCPARHMTGGVPLFVSRLLVGGEGEVVSGICTRHAGKAVTRHCGDGTALLFGLLGSQVMCIPQVHSHCFKAPYPVRRCYRLLLVVGAGGCCAVTAHAFPLSTAAAPPVSHGRGCPAGLQVDCFVSLLTMPRRPLGGPRCVPSGCCCGHGLQLSFRPLPGPAVVDAHVLLSLLLLVPVPVSLLLFFLCSLTLLLSNVLPFKSL